MSPSSEMGNYGNKLIQHVIVINGTVKLCQSEWVNKRLCGFYNTLNIIEKNRYIYILYTRSSKKPFNNKNLHNNTLAKLPIGKIQKY